MNKIRLIIGREYFTRIRKKTFILSTVLFPLLYLGLILGTGYITSKSGRKMNVAVLDSSGYFTKSKMDSLNLLDSSSRLTLVTESAKSLEANLEKSGYDGYLVIPDSVAWDKPLPFLKLNTTHTMSMEGTAPVQSKINALWMSIKNEKTGN